MGMVSPEPTRHLRGRIAWIAQHFYRTKRSCKVESPAFLVEGYIGLQHSPCHSDSRARKRHKNCRHRNWHVVSMPIRSANISSAFAVPTTHWHGLAAFGLLMSVTSKRRQQLMPSIYLWTNAHLNNGYRRVSRYTSLIFTRPCRQIWSRSTT